MLARRFLAWGAWTGGTWFLRSWGPALYFVVVAPETMIVLFVAPSALTPTTILPLALAGLLWFVVANRVR